MERRALGKTGVKLSLVGFGAMVVRDEPPDSASRLVARAVERGINYFDVAPTYGNAQQVLGPALEPYRPSVFLACKTGERSRERAWAELQQSLADLRTDHLDLYQLHAVGSMDDVEQITAPGGALEAFRQARVEGLVRFLGFSVHDEEAGLALIDRFEFDSVLFPVNWVSWHQGGFGPRLLARAEALGVARLAIKALARRPWADGEAHTWPKCWYAPVEGPEEAALALRFTLSRPVTAAVSPSHAELLWWACDAADRFAPLAPEEEATLAARTRGIPPLFPL